VAVAPSGILYVNTWSGRYYHYDTPPPGGFLVALQDTKGDGRADKVVRFGPTKADGNAGGTGIAIYKGYLYAETNDRIVRYQLPTDGIAPMGAPETVVSGLPLTGDHPMHPLAIDGQGRACRHPAFVRDSHHERAETAHLFFQQANRVIEFVAAKRVAADQFGESIGLVDGGRADRPHFVKRHGHTARRSLPGCFRSGEPAADDGDHATVSASSSERA